MEYLTKCSCTTIREQPLRCDMQDGVACNASLAELARDETVMCSSVADHAITQVCATISRVPQINTKPVL